MCSPPSLSSLQLSDSRLFQSVPLRKPSLERLLFRIMILRATGKFSLERLLVRISCSLRATGAGVAIF